VTERVDCELDQTGNSNPFGFADAVKAALQAAQPPAALDAMPSLEFESARRSIEAERFAEGIRGVRAVRVRSTRALVACSSPSCLYSLFLICAGSAAAGLCRAV
jgi:hypothetical protein